MMQTALVIGCGITGSVIARYLAEEKGMQVTVWEKRNHIGGNLYDYTDAHGIRVHKYGPHIFHTKKKEIFDYVCRFSQWEPFQLICGAVIDGICTPTAFNFKTIDLFYAPKEAEHIKNRLKEKFGMHEAVSVIELMNSDDEVIRNYARFLFDKDYGPYTAKQWGIPLKDVDVSILGRVPVRLSYEEAYFSDEFQAMPKHGYTNFIANILDHENISVKLEMDALEHLKIENARLTADGKAVDRPVIYTGPLDELWKCFKGKLPYRSLRFEWHYDQADSFQQMPVVAYPQAEGYTRITEYKKLPVQDVKGTSYAVEYPLPYSQEQKDAEPYYPVLTRQSKKLHEKYCAATDRVEHFYYCGRLADFQYYDMDQAIEHAFQFLKRNPF